MIASEWLAFRSFYVKAIAFKHIPVGSVSQHVTLERPHCALPQKMSQKLCERQ